MTNSSSQSRSDRVLVILGGDSPERAVSLESGQAVLKALAGAGYTVGLWDPAETAAEQLNPSDWDVAFPMLHGTGGEDGQVHQHLQAMGLPWVGCSIDGSSLTFDKSLTRERLQAHDVPVPRGCTVTSVDAPLPQVFPVVVKPARQGSSIGISLVHHEDQWVPALREALALSSDVVVESYIAGRELSVPVIDGEVFPVVEIAVRDGWYDYHNKYEADTTSYCVAPSDVPSDLGQLALRACQVCDVEGIMRVDFRLDENGRSFILEINTIPGMTAHSLVPMSAAFVGMSLSELCDRSVQHRLSSAEKRP